MDSHDLLRRLKENQMKKQGFALFLFALATAVLMAADYNAEGQRWWAHIENLANDSMEGRNTGSPGHLKAAQYVAGEFERAGLKPAGTDGGYLQPVEFDVKQLDEPNSSVMLVRRGSMEVVALGEDANLSSRGMDGDLNASAVFVGYGLTVPEKGYDDLAGLDLKGKVVVMLAGGPKMPSALRAHYSSQGERWKFLKAAGVVGVVTIPNPKSMDIPWTRQALARSQPSMVLSEGGLQETQGQQFLMTFNPEHADKLFVDTGHTIAQILDDADHDRPLPHFPLKVTIRAHTALQQSKVQSQNVAAVWPGTDPQLKDQYVVLSAHLDHVGVGQPINGDSIYNGAMDDASGIATVLEVARILHDSHAKLRRSVLLLAVTGEEKGLQGSRYYAAHTTVHGDLVADINLDMFLPLHALHYLEVQGLDESTLGDEIRLVAAAAHVEVQADKEPNRNLFIRSDQYSFIRKGVPALAFKFGYLPGSPEEKLHKDWLRDRYHAPSDDLNQPVDKAAAARFNEIILKLAERVANDDQKPAWKQDSFFRRFAN
jgi:hypothetical protein